MLAKLTLDLEFSVVTATVLLWLTVTTTVTTALLRLTVGCSFLTADTAIITLHAELTLGVSNYQTENTVFYDTTNMTLLV